MHTRSLVLAAATAAAASAHAPVFGHQANKRALLQARQTSPGELGSMLSEAAASATGCLAPLLSIYASLPTPPADLYSYELANPVSDYCDYKVPNSLTSQFSSYETAVSSWLATESSALSSALSACPEYSSLGTSLGSLCSTAIKSDSSKTSTGVNTAPSSTKTSGNDNNSTSNNDNGNNDNGNGNNDNNNNDKPNAGSRETGVWAGAVVAAGVIAIVAAL